MHEFVCVYACLDPRPYSFNPRLFHLTSISGAFEATEIVNPARNNINIVTSFPVLQSDMYNASQPGEMRDLHLFVLASR